MRIAQCPWRNCRLGKFLFSVAFWAGYSVWIQSHTLHMTTFVNGSFQTLKVVKFGTFPKGVWNFSDRGGSQKMGINESKVRFSKFWLFHKQEQKWYSSQSCCIYILLKRNTHQVLTSCSYAHQPPAPFSIPIYNWCTKLHSCSSCPEVNQGRAHLIPDLKINRSEY